jgi:hypothetical protein
VSIETTLVLFSQFWRKSEMKFHAMFRISVALSALVALTVGAKATIAAEVFALDDGLALNTNNNYVKIDGFPKISLWPKSLNDNDQQFDRIGASRGQLFKQKSTGLCLNAARKYSLGQVNTWPCNPNDQDQQFEVVYAGQAFNLIRLVGTNWCINAPYHAPQANITLFQCNTGDRDQRFIIQSTPLPDSYTTREVYNSKYYAMLISGVGSSSSPGFLGHTWASVFTFNGRQTLYYKNGVFYKADPIVYSQGDITTLTAWSKYNDVPKTNGSEDITATNNIINGINNPNDVVRYFEIDANIYSNAIGVYKSQTGCGGYAYVPVGNLCNCTAASTRWWKLITGEDLTNFSAPTYLKLYLVSVQNGQSMIFRRPGNTLIP